jgi:hypothetical protein
MKRPAEDNGTPHLNRPKDIIPNIKVIAAEHGDTGPL